MDEQILAILDRIGSDTDAPNITDLAAARDALRDSVRSYATSAEVNLDELLALKDAFTKVSEALSAAQAAEAEVAAQIEAVVAEVEGDDAPTDEAPEADAPTAEAEVQPIAASVRTALQRLTPRQAAPTAPNLAQTRTSVVLGNRQHDGATLAEIGAEFAAQARTFRGGKMAVAQISTEYADDRTLNAQDAAGNQRKILDLFGAGVTPITAAGGCCSLPEPIYDTPMIGSLATPIRDSMDILGASRGAVSAYPPRCIPELGAAVWTCAEDAAVDPNNEATWKQCFEVVCTEEATATVEPIYQCAEIGTFQQRFAPEEWEASLFELNKLAARVGEVDLFTRLRNAATSTHTGIDAGSMYVNLMNTLGRAAALMRQDQRYADVEIIAYLPEWIKQAVREDMRARRIGSSGNDIIEATDAMLASAAAEDGVRIVYSLDIADLEDFQYDGALAAYPATVPTVLVPAGGAKVLDGGTRDLGINITDHELNRQNKVAAFSETYQGLLVRACNIKAIDIPVDVCGATIACGS